MALLPPITSLQGSGTRFRSFACPIISDLDLTVCLYGCSNNLFLSIKIQDAWEDDLESGTAKRDLDMSVVGASCEKAMDSATVGSKYSDVYLCSCSLLIKIHIYGDSCSTSLGE